MASNRRVRALQGGSPSATSLVVARRIGGFLPPWSDGFVVIDHKHRSGIGTIRAARCPRARAEPFRSVPVLAALGIDNAVQFCPHF